MSASQVEDTRDGASHLKPTSLFTMTANNVSPVPSTNGSYLGVLVQIATLFAGSCVLPIALYWLLKYVAHLSESIGK